MTPEKRRQIIGAVVRFQREHPGYFQRQASTPKAIAESGFHTCAVEGIEVSYDNLLRIAREYQAKDKTGEE